MLQCRRNKLIIRDVDNEDILYEGYNFYLNSSKYAYTPLVIQ